VLSPDIKEIVMPPKLLMLLISLFATLISLFVVLVLPSMICTALWNAVVYELFGGVMIQVWQGTLLWMSVVIGLWLWLKPEIQLSVETLDEDDLPLPFQRKPLNKEAPKSKTPPSEHWLKWREKEKNNTTKKGS
jgi:hypothetical protein